MQKPVHSSEEDRPLDPAVHHSAQLHPSQGSPLTLPMVMTASLTRAVAATTEALVDGYQGSLIAAVQAVRAAAKGDMLQSAKKTRVAMTTNVGSPISFFLEYLYRYFLFI